MKMIKKWLLRITATGLLILALLIAIVLNPTTLYANKTNLKNVTVYHNTPLDKALLTRLSEAEVLIKNSEVYDKTFRFDLCVNDGSAYPSIIKQWQGDAFAWGYYNKVVLNGSANYSENYIQLNGYRWNMAQLIAHEAVHCLQYNALGFWDANPVAGYPAWKWEGYAEYVARKDIATTLQNDIQRYTNSKPNEWGITLADGTSIPRQYYKYWLMVRYCMDVKDMTFKEMLTDTTPEEIVWQDITGHFPS